MNKNKILIYIMIIISIILCIPSIMYLITNKTVDEFDFYYTYNLQTYKNEFVGLISGITIIGLLLIFGIIYILIIKKENKIFKSKKQIMLFIILISFIFMMILPYLSSDIYYYIGDSWIASKYNENPYYTSVSDLQEKGINDEILDNTGYWRNTTSVYGPLWNSIAKFLVGFSFGNITFALFIFKFSSYLIHVLNTYLIYKISKSRKYMLLYGLNPLILIEFMSNVHNDIYLIVFILLALYFLIRKKNIIFTIIFLAVSVSIKYSTILLVPFILIYSFKDKSIPKRILYCLISGLSILGLVVIFYMPYYRDFTIFTNMLVQGTKYSQSIMLFLTENINNTFFDKINKLIIPVFIIIYITNLVILLLNKKLKFKDIIIKYNFVMLIFIFVVLTNFQKWYILWLFPTIIWQRKNMRKFIIYLTITAIIPSIHYFLVGGDWYILGISYSIEILIISGTLLLIDVLINHYLLFTNKQQYKLEKI